MSENTGMDSSKEDLLQVLLLARDDQLSDEGLRKRWMSHQRSASVISFLPAAIAICFLLFIYGKPIAGALALIVVSLVAARVYARLLRKATSMTRQQLIGGIHS